MNLNYEKKYAYCEVDCILDFLGDEYKSKIPKKVLQTIKEQKKFAYRPEIDFTKPLENQVRQETKNIIASFNLKYWLKDENKKKELENRIKENAKIEKEKRRIERMKEIREKANIMSNGNTVTASIDRALKDNLND